MSQDQLLVMVRAYNEEANIQSVIANLAQNYSQYDAIVINDGSTDRTAEICRAKGFPILDLPVNLGLTGAFRAGMKYALDMGYDYVVQIDGDGQHDPRYISVLFNTMRDTEADIVNGSRFMTRTRRHNLRILGSGILSGMIRMMCHQTITDPTSGLRIYNRAMIRFFACETHFSAEPDTLVYLMLQGRRIVEVPAEMNDRQGGASYFNLARSARFMLEMCLSILLIMPIKKRR